MHVSERSQVVVPPALSDALRERVRHTDGEDIAQAPLSMLIRYAIARFAGIPQDQAVRYLHNLPRGNPKAKRTRRPRANLGTRKPRPRHTAGVPESDSSFQ
jgi:hypothetical protein